MSVIVINSVLQYNCKVLPIQQPFRSNLTLFKTKPIVFHANNHTKGMPTNSTLTLRGQKPSAIFFEKKSEKHCKATL